MNWKNITLESGFIRQEISFNGTTAVNYIPVDQIDSFGVVNSENKKWLQAGIFVGVCSLLLFLSQQAQVATLALMFSALLIGAYIASRKTWLNIISSQTKFSIQVTTSAEELQAVNYFVQEIKKSIQSTQFQINSKAA